MTHKLRAALSCVLLLPVAYAFCAEAPVDLADMLKNPTELAENNQCIQVTISVNKSDKIDWEETVASFCDVARSMTTKEKSDPIARLNDVHRLTTQAIANGAPGTLKIEFKEK